MPYEKTDSPISPSNLIAPQADTFNCEGLVLSESISGVVLFSVAQRDFNRARRPWLTTSQSLAIDRLQKLNKPCKVRILVPSNSSSTAGGSELNALLCEQHPGVDIECTEALIETTTDYGEVYRVVRTWLADYPWQIGREAYFGDISTGTAIARTAMMQMMLGGDLPAHAIQNVRNLAANIIDLVAIQLNANADFGLPATSLNLQQRAKPHWTTQCLPRDEVFKRTNMVIRSGSGAPVLFLGDTGTGKTTLAKEIAKINKLSFIQANCATIHRDQANSELFGHKKGAFTGATSDRKGLLLEADNGILILDEIGELGLQEQGMLLKAIEEKSFTPLGANTPIISSFTLIACTNRNLEYAVSEGTFRHDLLARICKWKFRLPSLVESRESILGFIDDALEEFLEACKLKNDPISFEEKARAIFQEFAESDGAPWPGNIRELFASVHRMATMAIDNNKIITMEIVNREIEELQSEWNSQQILHSAPESRLVQTEATTGNMTIVHSYPKLFLLNPKADETLEYGECVLMEALINVCLAAKTKEEVAEKFYPLWYKDKDKVVNSDTVAQKVKRALQPAGLTWEMIDQLRSL